MKEGYGLVEVPKEMTYDLVCSWFSCSAKTKLYVSASVKTDGTSRGFQKVIDKIRPLVLCKFHAQKYYDQ